MPKNNLDYAQIMMKKLDQQIIQGATSGWMEANAGQVEYDGGAEVKIPTLATQGLAEYDRANGFTAGTVDLTYETYKMTQDRGRTFSLDAMDVNETNFVATATNTLNVFQQQEVIPEIDAYRYSKIATIAKGDAEHFESIEVTADNALDKLLEHIASIEDVTGSDQNLIISIPNLVLRLVEQSPQIHHHLNVGEFQQGNLNFKVKTIDDHIIRTVPSARMKTEYELLDGKSDGQEAGGFKAAATAEDINWLITPQNVPLAISKTDKIRIFNPDENLLADAYKVDYRKYHDLWILKNKEASIFACIKPSV